MPKIIVTFDLVTAKFITNFRSSEIRSSDQLPMTTSRDSGHKTFKLELKWYYEVDNPRVFYSNKVFQNVSKYYTNKLLNSKNVLKTVSCQKETLRPKQVPT